MLSQSFKSELDLPSGSLDCALSAFENGADGVYLGLKSFSARSQAVNFSFEDLSKLRAKALGKIYVTINTILKPDQLDQALNLCAKLEPLQVDGLIIQDLGLAREVRRLFPSMAIQASTQLAVHSSEGVRQLRDLGFSRIVLARELSLTEIETIRKECEDVELKVFIHGALCYGFSGLCMASRTITGRSANCGSCAQICRTWFSCRNSKGYYFSMCDLNAGKLVKDLSSMGIDALKVEGRMKSPLYTGLCARYYRHILDDEDEFYEADLEALRLAFDRGSSASYLSGNRDLINSDYPGHRGLEAGTIESIGRSSVVIRAKRHLCNHDGLMCFKDQNSASFAIKGLKPFAAPSQRFSLDIDPKTLGAFGVGRSVYLVSEHTQNPKSYNTESMQPYKRSIDLSFDIDRCLHVSALGFSKAYDVPISPSTSKALEEGLQNVFSSGSYRPKSINLVDSNGPSFIPLSALKNVRRDFYSSLDEYLESQEPVKAQSLSFPEPSFVLPRRSELPLWDQCVTYGNQKYLSLRPVLFCPGPSPLKSFNNEEEYFEAIDKILKEDDSIIVGLNNISQLGFAHKHPNIRFFGDIYLYVANAQSFKALGLEAAYTWAEENLDLGIPALFDPGDFDYPLFISRTCFRHSSLKEDCSSCRTKSYDYPISQNGKNYLVSVRDCTTIVYKR